MGRALAAVGALLVLCFVIFGAVIFVTREEDRVAVDSALAEDLTRAVVAVNDTEDPLEVARYAKFDWDELLLVAKDTPRSVLSAELGFEFKGDLPYDAESGELFVFLRDGELARFADYRGHGLFADFDPPIGRFARAEAVFEVRDLVARPKSP